MNILGTLLLPFFCWTLLCFSAFADDSTVNQNEAPKQPDEPSKGVIVVAGATGYIGMHVVQESIRQGYKTIALVRDLKKADAIFKGAAHVVSCNVTDPQNVTLTLQEITQQEGTIDGLISCQASRTGTKKEVFQIDYRSNKILLDSGRTTGARVFVLLSAFCVRNPKLQLQQAKLKFEEALQAQQDMSWTIVRPTAFFKSISGQVENLKGGSRFVLFGDGEITRCNPIAAQDVAEYLVDSVSDETRHSKIFNLGGRSSFTNKQIGEMIFATLGKTPKFFHIPLGVLDTLIATFSTLFQWTGLESMENAAETARIVHYYATESMLTTDTSEMYGSITLQDHFNQLVEESEEYDPNMHLIWKPKRMLDGLWDKLKLSNKTDLPKQIQKDKDDL